MSLTFYNKPEVSVSTSFIKEVGQASEEVGKKINRAVRRSNVRAGGDQVPSHSLPISMPPIITCGVFVYDNLIIA